MTPLAEVAEAYRRHLPPGETSTFRVDGLDRLGLPVVIAPYRTADGLLFDGFGYGATEVEALVGALGEISEQVHCERWMAAAERVRGSHVQLVREHGAAHVADPLTLCLPAGSSYTPDAELTWVWGERLGAAEPVLLPVEFVAVHRGQLRGVPPLVTPITNGLGAGLCREQALAHGLLELLQRDGNTVSFRALDQGTVIDTGDGLDAETAGLLARLRDAGLRVTVKLAAADFGAVDVYVVGDDDREPWFPMQLTACGEAAHPDRNKAVRKAALEYAAARSRKAFMHGPLDRIREVTPPGYLDRYLSTLNLAGEEPRCLQSMTEWVMKSAGELRAMLSDSVFAERRRVPLTDLPTAPPAAVSDPRGRYERVLTGLIEGGCDMYAVDFSPPGGAVFATKVVVAGLECETMSYHRLGERGVRRLLERGDRWVGLGEPPAGAKRVPLTRAAEGRLGGPAWLDPAAVDALVGPLYPLYREPNSHTAQVNLAGRGAA